MDRKIGQLLKFGYRARLEQTPALIGATSIALVPVKGAGAAELAYDGPNPRIPSAPGAGSVDDITSQADQILAKVNRIPIEEIGANLRLVTGRLSALASSPKMDDSLAHLTRTLAEVDQILGQIQPQVGPLLTKLNDAADQVSGIAQAAHQLLGGEDTGGANLSEAISQLDQAARSIRTLADYLDRHPDALIRGKRPDRP
jgi:ABC-type transporter Mla subunit MlaD